MGIQDTITKLKIQASALMRGIHGDFILVERADFKVLLADHERLTKLMWSGIDRSMEQWAKEHACPPEEFRKQYMQEFRPCQHEHHNPVTDAHKCRDCGADLSGEKEFKLYGGGREGGKAFTDAQLKKLKDEYLSREKPLENNQHAGKICDMQTKDGSSTGPATFSTIQQAFLDSPEATRITGGAYPPAPTIKTFCHFSVADSEVNDICEHNYEKTSAKLIGDFVHLQCAKCGHVRVVEGDSNEN